MNIVKSIKAGAMALGYVVVALVVVALIAAVLPGVIADRIGEALGKLNPLATETIDNSGPAMLERIRDLEEFTAAQASFTQDVDVEQDTRLPDFIAGESVVAIVTGSVRASVDLGGLDEGSIEVDEEADTIRIRLPDPVLSPAEIDEESTRIIDRDRGLVDRLGDLFAENPTDDLAIFTHARERMNAAAEESDLMSRAHSNTETWFATFLGAAGFDTVEISWPESNGE